MRWKNAIIAKLNGRMQRMVMDQGDCVSFEWMLNIDIDIGSIFKCTLKRCVA